MASTARSIEAQAVITTTGSVASMARRRLEQVEPFLAGGRVARVVEVDQDRVVLRALDRRQNGAGRRDDLEGQALALEEQT